MDRRDLLRIFSGVAALPALQGFTVEEVWAIGRELHRALERRSQRGPVLTEAQLRLTAAIAERIIPATDTPGAQEARVAEFIDLLLADWYDDAGRARFLDGLVQIDARSRRANGKPFIELTESQQTALLDELDAEVQALRGARVPVDNHFFQQMKWLTIHGYYTSEVGALQELHWVAIPGGYDPCRAYVPRSAGGF
jgi:hypothetical protein